MSGTSTSQTSYRQALAAALQRHRMTGTYTLGSWGPDHALKWYCTFSMNGQVIGSSGEQSTKVAAKEAAAYAALAYLATQNFDVAYVFHNNA